MINIKSEDKEEGSHLLVLVMCDKHILNHKHRLRLCFQDQAESVGGQAVCVPADERVAISRAGTLGQS
jgi:hypothetical protein